MGVRKDFREGGHWGMGRNSLCDKVEGHFPGGGTGGTRTEWVGTPRLFGVLEHRVQDRKRRGTGRSLPVVHPLPKPVEVLEHGRGLLPRE